MLFVLALIAQSALAAPIALRAKTVHVCEGQTRVALKLPYRTKSHFTVDGQYGLNTSFEVMGSKGHAAGGGDIDRAILTVRGIREGSERFETAFKAHDNNDYTLTLNARVYDCEKKGAQRLVEALHTVQQELETIAGSTTSQPQRQKERFQNTLTAVAGRLREASNLSAGADKAAIDRLLDAVKNLRARIAATPAGELVPAELSGELLRLLEEIQRLLQ